MVRLGNPMVALALQTLMTAEIPDLTLVQRVQQGDPTAHAEVDCIRNAGRRRDWSRCTLISTLSPCQMCTGTAVLFKIPRVIIGENKTYLGGEDWMKEKGMEVRVLQDPRCIALMERMKREKPDLWAEDIGE